MNLTRHGFERVLQKFPSSAAAGHFYEAGHGELAGSVCAPEETGLSFGSRHLSDIDMEAPGWITFELPASRLVPFDIRQAQDAMPLKAALQRRTGAGIVDCGAQRQSSSGSSVWRRKATIVASSASVRTVDRGSFGPVLRSSTVARFRHLATVFGLMLISWLNAESEAFDRCIAALTANVVVALP